MSGHGASGNPAKPRRQTAISRFSARAQARCHPHSPRICALCSTMTQPRPNPPKVKMSCSVRRASFPRRTRPGSHSRAHSRSGTSIHERRSSALGKRIGSAPAQKPQRIVNLLAQKQLQGSATMEEVASPAVEDPVAEPEAFPQREAGGAETDGQFQVTSPDTPSLAQRFDPS